MIEESAPFSLGISFEPDLVKVARNGELLEVELFQHVPITCKRRDHMCSLQISFISKLLNPRTAEEMGGTLPRIESFENTFDNLSVPSIYSEVLGFDNARRNTLSRRQSVKF